MPDTSSFERPRERRPPGSSRRRSGLPSLKTASILLVVAVARGLGLAGAALLAVGLTGVTVAANHLARGMRRLAAPDASDQAFPMYVQEIRDVAERLALTTA